MGWPGWAASAAGLHHLVEVFLNVRAGHLDPGLKAHLDEQQQRALPEQQVLDILVGDAVIRQGALVFRVVRKVLLFERFEHRRHLGGAGNRVPADFQFTPDEHLLHHALGGSTLAGRAEVGLHPIQKSGHPDFPIEVAFGDHAIAHRDGDAIDDLGGRREGERQQGQDQSEWAAPLQNVCPMEKKY
jgi:hypothetical protein